MSRLFNRYIRLFAYRLESKSNYQTKSMKPFTKRPSDWGFLPGISTDKLHTMPVAVLASGGIESASLVWILKEHFDSVQPLYVRFGLKWEKVEYQYLLQYLEAIKHPGIKPLKVIEIPIDNIYGKHWSTTDANVPDTNTTDEAVYLPGRNLMLLTQTAVWCVLNQINHIALGSLGTNPFPDAGDKFLLQLQNTLTTGLDFDINILRPYRNLHKPDVILAAKHLPLHLTFSCINPIISSDDGAASIHCGICNKCGERQKAFIEAQIEDLTAYASSQPLAITATR